MNKISNSQILAFVGMPGAGKTSAIDYLTQKNIPKVYFGGVVLDALRDEGYEINEVNEKMMRDLRRKFDVEANKKEIEIIDHWKQEIESVYRKKYDNLAAVQIEMKRVIERMGNRISILTKMVREES